MRGERFSAQPCIKAHANIFFGDLTELAGSVELIDPDHTLSTFTEKLSTPSESRTDNGCLCVTAPAYTNSAHFLNQQSGERLNDLELPFTADELSRYVASRSIGLAERSCDWINRSAKAFWRATQGVFSRQRMDVYALKHLSGTVARGATARLLRLSKRFVSI